ncbi:MAG: hypothetical protein H0V25_09430 [Solirubrobacterales bacterium]|nr:hypothetical protein [Solirubrobacterales bacterium]
MRFLRENSLSLFFGTILLLSVAGQSVAGEHQYNADAAEHGQKAISWAHYLVTPEFGGDLLENWQSEFLQFSLYILATVWLLQRGSNESKALGKAGQESDEEQQVGEYARPNSPAWAKAAGIRRWIYSNSLMFLMTAIFFLSWFGQSVNGWRAFNNTRDEHKGTHISYGEYLVNADFWDRSLQNWQSEFLAVGSIAAFTIYLRQRGSPESKPVGAPHDETASSG